MSFGKRLKQARKDKKLLQAEVANKLGIDDTTISKYENDKSEPDNKTIDELATLYGVSVDWLIGRNKKESDFSPPKSNVESIVRRIEKESGISIDNDPLILENIETQLKMYVKLRKDNSQNK